MPISETYFSFTRNDILLATNNETFGALCRIVIANGRLYKDRQLGEYTFCSHASSSVVDYLLFKIQIYSNEKKLNEALNQDINTCLKIELQDVPFVQPFSVASDDTSEWSGSGTIL